MTKIYWDITSMACLKCKQNITGEEAYYGLHLSCFKAWFNVSGAAEFVSLQRRKNTSEDEAPYAQANTSFFHGRYKKYSAELEGQSYILKMRQDDAGELPEVEYLCNQIGKQLNVPVAEFYYIDFHDDKVFVTKNFMSVASQPMNLQHIYHYREDKAHHCSGIIDAIMKETKKPYDVKTIIKTILFDSLIGNHDRHGRNLAFIVKANECSLSPIYDNVSYLALEEGSMLKAHHNPTGKISTSATLEPSMKDYVAEFGALGYEGEIEEFYQSINFEKIIKLINESFCSDLMKEAIIKLVQRRYEELEHALCNH